MDELVFVLDDIIKDISLERDHMQKHLLQECEKGDHICMIDGKY